MIFKIIFNKEIHLYAQSTRFEDLLAFIRNSFHKLPKNILLTYVDDEGDRITISNDTDINTLETLTRGKTSKIYIYEAESLIKESEDQFQQIIVPLDDEAKLHEWISQNQTIINRRIIHHLDQQENQLLQELICTNLSNLYTKVTNQIINEQLEMIKEIAKSTVIQITRLSLERYLQSQNDKAEARVEKIDEDYIRRIVDERIKALIPIIRKKTKLVQSSKYCENCQVQLCESKPKRNKKNIQNCESQDEVFQQYLQEANKKIQSQRCL